MEPSELLRHLASTLDTLEVPYFVTGSTASIAYGEPRFTNDIDVVVDLPAARIPALCAAFPFPEYYLSENAVREAVAGRHQFNIIHPGSGLKIDVVVGKETPFDHGRFARRRLLVTASGLEAYFASPEDVILKKLQFYREGGSEKHLRDIAGMLKVSSGNVDLRYIAEWARALGVEAEWKAVVGREP